MAGCDVFVRFLGDRRANMSILMAAGLSVSTFIAALAIDSAALNQERRRFQSAVDLAALAAARDPSQARTIAEASLAAAGFETGPGGVTLRLETGRYLPDPALAPAARFSVGTEPANAVRLAADRPGTLYFASGWSPPPTIGVGATATVTPRAAFTIGSRLARLEGGIANAVLGDLLGTEIALSALDYRALADLRVDAFSFLDALAGELGVTAGTYEDVLAAEAGHAYIASALAAVADGADAALLEALASAIGPGRHPAVAGASLIDLGDLGELRIGAGSPNLLADVSALDLLAASASLADGTKQVGLALSAGVPGLATLTLDLTIGEPAQQSGWMAVGEVGARVETAQLRLRLEARLLGGSGLLGAAVTVPILLELAPSAAELTAITCPTAANPHGTARLAVRPGLARLAIGTGASGGALAPATLVNALILKVTGRAVFEIAEPMPIPVDFTGTEIAAQTVKTVSSGGYVTALGDSLLDTLVLDIDILGLGLGLGGTGAVGSALRGLLAPLAPVIDVILDEVLAVAGLRLGEADLTVLGVTCHHPVLVG
jgi:uncharacterized membrane protein